MTTSASVELPINLRMSKLGKFARMRRTRALGRSSLLQQAHDLLTNDEQRIHLLLDRRIVPALVLRKG